MPPATAATAGSGIGAGESPDRPERPLTGAPNPTIGRRARQRRDTL